MKGVVLLVSRPALCALCFCLIAQVQSRLIDMMIHLDMVFVLIEFKGLFGVIFAFASEVFVCRSDPTDVFVRSVNILSSDCSLNL